MWADAKEAAADVLEGEGFRRAVRGWDEPVFYEGRRVGSKRRYSDQLLTLLLKAARPDKFRESVSLEHSGAIDLAGAQQVLRDKVMRIGQTGGTDDQDGDGGPTDAAVPGL